MKSSLIVLIAAIASSQGIELTPANWDTETAGKTVFIKFFAPWCGHCKAMKPDWDKLMEEFNSSDNQLIADVDCTAEGQPLCEGVQGFPTLKWGDPSALEDYEGARDYDSLKAFAQENLKPMCSPKNIDLCDAEKKAEIEKYQKMDPKELAKLIEDKEAELEKTEKDFETFIEGLQKQFEDEMKVKEEKVKSIKASGLGLMKAVKASVSSGKDEL